MKALNIEDDVKEALKKANLKEVYGVFTSNNPASNKLVQVFGKTHEDELYYSRRSLGGTEIFTETFNSSKWYKIFGRLDLKDKLLILGYCAIPTLFIVPLFYLFSSGKIKKERKFWNEFERTKKDKDCLEVKVQ